jgi:hypothetical protein
MKEALAHVDLLRVLVSVNVMLNSYYQLDTFNGSLKSGLFHKRNSYTSKNMFRCPRRAPGPAAHIAQR